jgi:hypothetical protein
MIQVQVCMSSSSAVAKILRNFSPFFFLQSCTMTTQCDLFEPWVEPGPTYYYIDIFFTNLFLTNIIGGNHGKNLPW